MYRVIKKRNKTVIPPLEFRKVIYYKPLCLRIAILSLRIDFPNSLQPLQRG